MSQLWSKQPASPSPNGDTASPTTPPLDAALDVVASPTTGGRQRNPGRRFAQIIKLKPECVDQYKECHAAVWPEVQRQIKACNIQDYSICHDPETRILFASFKYVGYDYAGDMERMRENPKVREWWAMTDSYQEVRDNPSRHITTPLSPQCVDLYI
jgi:L-rhamnose mutarotase